jgi:hypothetical protein
MPEQPVVLGVRPDPEPDQIGPIFDRHRSIMQTDADRPEATDPLQVQRGMARVLAKQLITGVGQPLGLDRVGGDRIARTSGSRGGSQVGATPVAPVPQGLVGQGIQPALGDVALELAVPGRRVELGEPGA